MGFFFIARVFLVELLCSRQFCPQEPETCFQPEEMETRTVCEPELSQLGSSNRTFRFSSQLNSLESLSFVSVVGETNDDLCEEKRVSLTTPA